MELLFLAASATMVKMRFFRAFDTPTLVASSSADLTGNEIETFDMNAFILAAVSILDLTALVLSL